MHGKFFNEMFNNEAKFFGHYLLLINGEVDKKNVNGEVSTKNKREAKILIRFWQLSFYNEIFI